jgi:asparagine synthase (glutamine-hydrolysing)
VRTFSIGFAEADYDEVRFARWSRALRHRARAGGRAAGEEVLPKLVRTASPSGTLGGPGAVRLGSALVTVALSGDGGDEAFGGYQRYLADRLIAGLLPGLREGVVRRAIEALPAPRRPRGFVGRLKRFVATADPERERQYVRYFCAFANEDKAGLYSPAFAARTAGVDSVALVEELYRRADGGSFLDRTLSVDMHSYLPDDILAKVDIAGMGNALETAPLSRSPPARVRGRLPLPLKLRGLTGKYLLKKALARTCHPRSYGARWASGCRSRWFRAGSGDGRRPPLSPRACKAGTSGRLERLLKHRRRARPRHPRVLLFLELWFQEFVDRELTFFT